MDPMGDTHALLSHNCWSVRWTNTVSLWEGVTENPRTSICDRVSQILQNNFTDGYETVSGEAPDPSGVVNVMYTEIFCINSHVINIYCMWGLGRGTI